MKLRYYNYLKSPTKTLAKQLLSLLYSKDLISTNTYENAILQYSLKYHTFYISASSFTSTEIHNISENEQPRYLLYTGQEFKETKFIAKGYSRIYSKEFGLIEFLSYNEFINYIKTMKDWIDILCCTEYIKYIEEDINNIDSSIKFEYLPSELRLEEIL